MGSTASCGGGRSRPESPHRCLRTRRSSTKATCSRSCAATTARPGFCRPADFTNVPVVTNVLVLAREGGTSMRAWTPACVAGLTLWILAGSSLAGTLEVQFALGGQLSVSLGLISEPGSTSGTARVVLTGVDSLGALSGPSATASLRDLTLQTTLAPTGVFRFSQVAPVTGAFDGAMFGVAAGSLTFLGVNPVGAMAS